MNQKGWGCGRGELWWCAGVWLNSSLLGAESNVFCGLLCSLCWLHYSHSYHSCCEGTFWQCFVQKKKRKMFLQSRSCHAVHLGVSFFTVNCNSQRTFCRYVVINWYFGWIQVLNWGHFCFLLQRPDQVWANSGLGAICNPLSSLNLPVELKKNWY